ncbi:hypothetical protein SNEBB_000286 [Seison nebaliae]|nr:hypothetical protein SNEBB_000286 [Seison nebaliae]
MILSTIILQPARGLISIFRQIYRYLLYHEYVSLPVSCHYVTPIQQLVEYLPTYVANKCDQYLYNKYETWCIRISCLTVILFGWTVIWLCKKIFRLITNRKPNHILNDTSSRYSHHYNTINGDQYDKDSELLSLMESKHSQSVTTIASNSTSRALSSEQNQNSSKLSTNNSSQRRRRRLYNMTNNSFKPPINSSISSQISGKLITDDSCKCSKKESWSEKQFSLSEIDKTSKSPVIRHRKKPLCDMSSGEAATNISSLTVANKKLLCGRSVKPSHQNIPKPSPYLPNYIEEKTDNDICVELNEDRLENTNSMFSQNGTETMDFSKLIHKQPNHQHETSSTSLSDNNFSREVDMRLNGDCQSFTTESIKEELLYVNLASVNKFRVKLEERLREFYSKPICYERALTSYEPNFLSTIIEKRYNYAVWIDLLGSFHRMLCIEVNKNYLVSEHIEGDNNEDSCDSKELSISSITNSSTYQNKYMIFKDRRSSLLNLLTIELLKRHFESKCRNCKSVLDRWKNHCVVPERCAHSLCFTCGKDKLMFPKTDVFHHTWQYLTADEQKLIKEYEQVNEFHRYGPIMKEIEMLIPWNVGSYQIPGTEIMFGALFESSEQKSCPVCGLLSDKYWEVFSSGTSIIE